MIVADLDAIASTAERRWGIGRLPLLVPADLAARFEQMQQMHRDKGHLPHIVAGMARAWQALDAAAQAAGHVELARLTWEAVPPAYGCPDDEDRPWYLLDGRIAVVRDEAHGKRVHATAKALGIEADVWPALEAIHCALVRSPEAMTTILGTSAVVARRVMDAFPGATLSIRAKPRRLPSDDLSDILPLPGEAA